MNLTTLRRIGVLVLLLALPGCGARQHTDSAAGTDSSGTGSATAAEPTPVDAQLHEISELTNQVIIYECPKCGMMFDGPGHCTMDGTELYPTKVTYVCPADHMPADHAGKCPRCDRQVQIMKAKMLPGGIKGEMVN